MFLFGGISCKWIYKELPPNKKQHKCCRINKKWEQRIANLKRGLPPHLFTHRTSATALTRRWRLRRSNPSLLFVRAPRRVEGKGVKRSGFIRAVANPSFFCLPLIFEWSFFCGSLRDSFSLSRLGRLVCGCQMCSAAFATMEYRLRNICSNKFGSYSQPIFQTFGFSAHFPPFGLLSASAAVRILLQTVNGVGGDVKGICGVRGVRDGIQN